MTRFIPPHLMILGTLLIVVLWAMLVRHFRHSVATQRFVSEILGDDTPENALLAFDIARTRLVHHLKRNDLDLRTRQRIELALGNPDHESTES